MRYSYFYSLAIILIFSSCKKYLDEKADKSLIVPTTLNDLQALLDNDGAMLRQAPSFGETSSDDFFLTDDVYNGLDLIDNGKYTWKPVDYIYSNDWSTGYLPVYNANLCLEQLDQIPKTTVNSMQWDNIKGSALFHRGLNFLNLAWVYAKAYDVNTYGSDLGIVLRLSSDFNIPSKRATVKETYERLINDLESSVNYLPVNSIHPYRPSKAAAYGMLARAYLSIRNYDQALKNVELCLSIKSQLLDYNDNTQVTLTANVPFKAFNPEIIFYTQMNALNSLQATFQALVDTALYSKYHDNDLRKTAFFRVNGKYKRFKGSYAANINNLFSGLATDEMYLTRAECYARKGEISKAMDDLNTLSVKRWKNGVPFVPFVASTKQDALEKILLERRKELMFRGIRWIDIKRLNKEDMNIILTRKAGGKVFSLLPNANYYALPLPKDIIDHTGMPQNPY